jgi:lipopolysaccharide transport system permease protein
MFPDFRELWRFKELLYFLLWRDLKARYKQTFFGASWVIMRPLIQMAMTTFIFNQVAGIQAPDGQEYWIFSYMGFLIWQFFASSLTSGAGSVLSSSGLLGKAYLPRLFVPLAGATSPIVDFTLSLPITALTLVVARQVPGWELLTFPLFLLLALLLGFGFALWLAPITVRFRDVMFTLPFLIQIWLYATPIIYPTAIWNEHVPERWHWLLQANPMVAVEDGFRWSLLGQYPPSWTSIASSVGIMLVLVVTGLVNFRRAERTFIDVI